MLTGKLFATKIVVSLVAVGSLSAVGLGVAEAATPTSTPTASHSTAAGRERACKRLHRFEEGTTRGEARMAAAIVKPAALEAKALASGHTHVAAYWKSVVTRRTETLARRKAATAERLTRTRLKNLKIGEHC